MVLPSIGSNELSAPVRRYHRVANTVYSNNATQNYTFTSGSDVRFLSVYPNLATDTAFNSYMTNAYEFFTVLGCVLEYIPISTNVDQVIGTFLAPMLVYVNEAIITPANPTNSALVGNYSCLKHPMTKLGTSTKKFAAETSKFSNVNTAFNIKYNRSTTFSSGSIELGQLLASVFPVAAQLMGSLNVYYLVQYEGAFN